MGGCRSGKDEEFEGTARLSSALDKRLPLVRRQVLFTGCVYNARALAMDHAALASLRLVAESMR